MEQKVTITLERIKEVGKVNLPKDVNLFLDSFIGLHVGADKIESFRIAEKNMKNILKDVSTPISSVDIVTRKHKSYNVWVLHTIEKKTYMVDNFADAAIAIHEIYK